MFCSGLVQCRHRPHLKFSRSSSSNIDCMLRFLLSEKMKSGTPIFMDTPPYCAHEAQPIVSNAGGVYKRFDFPGNTSFDTYTSWFWFLSRSYCQSCLHFHSRKALRFLHSLPDKEILLCNDRIKSQRSAWLVCQATRSDPAPGGSAFVYIDNCCAETVSAEQPYSMPSLNTY